MYKTNFILDHFYSVTDLTNYFWSATKFQNLPYDFRVYKGLNYVHLYH